MNRQRKGKNKKSITNQDKETKENERNQKPDKGKERTATDK